jgi:hypothetical protein
MRNALKDDYNIVSHFGFSRFLECIPQKCSVRSELVRCYMTGIAVCEYDTACL